jgi:type 1 glutamine amidotransferase
MHRIIFSLLTSFAVSGAIAARASNPLKVLVITGKHNYNTNAFHALFNSFEGMECTVREMGGHPGSLFEQAAGFPYDAIVLYNFRQSLSEPARERFTSLLESGVGLTVMHHAIAGFPDWREYETIIGATYVLEEQIREGRHYQRSKWKHDVDMKIEVEDPQHPITSGVTEFIIHDETYSDWIFHKGNHLLLATDNEHSNREIAWTRSWSGTRIFCMQLGHDQHAFENETYRKLLRQGIVWTAKRRM